GMRGVPVLAGDAAPMRYAKATKKIDRFSDRMDDLACRTGLSAGQIARTHGWGIAVTPRRVVAQCLWASGGRSHMAVLRERITRADVRLSDPAGLWIGSTPPSSAVG